MSNTPSLAQLKEALAIHEQIDELQTRLRSIFGAGGSSSAQSATAPARRKPGRPRNETAAKATQTSGSNEPQRDSIPSSVGSTGGKAKRTMSPEARERIAAAQRARWAAARKQGDLPPVRSGMIKLPKKGGGITPEGRARLSAAMKARWTQRKAGRPGKKAK